MSDQSESHPLTPTVQLAFACENVSTDQQQRITFHNLVDNLMAPQFPATTPQLFVVFGFYSQAGSGCFVQPVIEVVSRKGDIILSQQLPQDVTFSPSTPTARVIVGINGVTWPHEDEYTVKFLVNKKVKASFPLKVSSPSGMPRSQG